MSGTVMFTKAGQAGVNGGVASLFPNNIKAGHANGQPTNASTFLKMERKPRGRKVDVAEKTTRTNSTSSAAFSTSLYHDKAAQKSDPQLLVSSVDSVANNNYKVDSKQQAKAEALIESVFSSSTSSNRRSIDLSEKVGQYVCDEVARNTPLAISRAFSVTPRGGDSIVHVRLECDGTSRRTRGRKNHKVDESGKWLVGYLDVNFITSGLQKAPSLVASTASAGSTSANTAESSGGNEPFEVCRLRNLPILTHKTPSNKFHTDDRRKERGMTSSERDAEILLEEVSAIVDCLLSPEHGADRIPSSVVIELASDSGEESTATVFISMFTAWIEKRDRERELSRTAPVLDVDTSRSSRNPIGLQSSGKGPSLINLRSFGNRAPFSGISKRSQPGSPSSSITSKVVANGNSASSVATPNSTTLPTVSNAQAAMPRAGAISNNSTTIGKRLFSYEEKVQVWWSRCEAHQLSICGETGVRRLVRVIGGGNHEKTLYLETEQHNLENSTVELLYGRHVEMMLQEEQVEQDPQRQMQLDLKRERKSKSLRDVLYLLDAHSLADQLFEHQVYRRRGDLVCKPGSRTRVAEVLNRIVTRKTASARLNRWLTFGAAARAADVRDLCGMRRVWAEKTEKPWFLDDSDWLELLKSKKRASEKKAEEDLANRAPVSVERPSSSLDIVIANSAASDGHGDSDIDFASDDSVRYQVWRTLVGIMLFPLEEAMGHMLTERGKSRHSRVVSISKCEMFIRDAFQRQRAKIVSDPTLIHETVAMVCNYDEERDPEGSFRDFVEGARRLMIVTLDAMELEALKRVILKESHQEFVHLVNTKAEETKPKTQVELQKMVEEIMDSLESSRATSIRSGAQEGKFLGSDPGTLILNGIRDKVKRSVASRWDLVSEVIGSYSSRHTQRIECKIGRLKATQTNRHLKGIMHINAISVVESVIGIRKAAKDYLECGSSSGEEDAYGCVFRKKKRKTQAVPKWERKRDAVATAPVPGYDVVEVTSIRDLVENDSWRADYTDWQARQLMRTNRWCWWDVRKTILPKSQWPEEPSAGEEKRFRGIADTWERERIALLAEDKLRTSLSEQRHRAERDSRLRIHFPQEKFLQSLKSITRDTVDVRTRFIQKYEKARDEQHCEHNPRLDHLEPPIRKRQHEFSIPITVVEGQGSSGVEKLCSWIGACHLVKKKKKRRQNVVGVTAFNNPSGGPANLSKPSFNSSDAVGGPQIRDGAPGSDRIAQAKIENVEDGEGSGEDVDVVPNDNVVWNVTVEEAVQEVASVLEMEDEEKKAITAEMRSTPGVVDAIKKYKTTPGIAFAIVNKTKATESLEHGVTSHYVGFVVYNVSQSPFFFQAKKCTAMWYEDHGHGSLEVQKGADGIYLSEQHRDELRKHDKKQVVFMSLQIPHWEIENIILPPTASKTVLVAGPCVDYNWSGHNWLVDWKSDITVPKTIRCRVKTSEEKLVPKIATMADVIARLTKVTADSRPRQRDHGIKRINEKMGHTLTSPAAKKTRLEISITTGGAAATNQPGRNVATSEGEKVLAENEDNGRGGEVKTDDAIEAGIKSATAERALVEVLLKFAEPVKQETSTPAPVADQDRGEQNDKQNGGEGGMMRGEEELQKESQPKTKKTGKKFPPVDIGKATAKGKKNPPKMIKYKMKSIYGGQSKVDRTRNLHAHQLRLKSRGCCLPSHWELWGAAQDKVVGRLRQDNDAPGSQKRWDTVAKVMKHRMGQILLSCTSTRLERSFTFGENLTLSQACEKADLFIQKAEQVYQIVEEKLNATVEELNQQLKRFPHPNSTPAVLKRWTQEELDWVRSLR